LQATDENTGQAPGIGDLNVAVAFARGLLHGRAIRDMRQNAFNRLGQALDHACLSDT